MPGINIGALVIYHNRPAAVENCSEGKIAIRLEGGIQKSVRSKDIEFLHPGPATTLPPPGLPTGDPAEIAELIADETIPFGDFAELLCSNRSAAAYWTAYGELGNAYFTGSLSDGVRARPPEERAALLDAAAAKERAAAARAELIARLKNGSFLPEDRSAIREIEQVARGESAASKLLRELQIEATPARAHQLLIRIGAWDYHIDPWPARAGVDLEAPDIAFAPPSPAEERVDLTTQEPCAIDNLGSEDPDDAIAFDGELLWVHVADPAASVPFGGELDLESARRGTTLYLPEMVVPMLPEAMTPLFGLGLSERSPALSFALRIDEAGDVELVRFCRSVVRVRRFTYENFREHWNDPAVAGAKLLLERFRARRAAAGARFINLPEAEIKLNPAGRVEIHPITITPEREFVANAMLAAGAAVGRWAVENDIPMPFSTQLPWEEEIQAAPGDLAAMYALRKSSPQGCIQTLPGPHSGLGLDAYIRVTSPLRRYCDLLAHQQLRRILTGTPPLSMEELDARLALSEPASRDKRRLERQVDEFWTMVYFTEHPEWEGDAVLVARQDDRLTFLIPELAFEFKNRYGGKIPLGGTVHARLQNVDPADLRISFKLEH